MHFYTANKFVRDLFEQGYFHEDFSIAKWDKIIK